MQYHSDLRFITDIHPLYVPPVQPSTSKKQARIRRRTGIEQNRTYPKENIERSNRHSFSHSPLAKALRREYRRQARTRDDFARRSLAFKSGPIQRLDLYFTTPTAYLSFSSARKEPTGTQTPYSSAQRSLELSPTNYPEYSVATPLHAYHAEAAGSGNHTAHETQLRFSS